MLRRALTGVCVLIACGSAAVPALAAPQPPFAHAGRWMTDASGRVFVSHGVNMVYKVPPYEPSVTGFGDDDAAFLAAEGFNTVRLGVIYKAVEPQPGVYDDAYLAKIAETAAILEKHGIAPLLDFHQDMYNERFQGEGWPDWAVIDDGLPAQPQTGFPGNYVVQPGLNRAFDNFWANAAGPQGAGIGDRYASAWKHVVARFASDPGILGYDLLNEPWPGTGWQQCANTNGCPAFDQGAFASFYTRTIKAVREADPVHAIYYEPNVLFNNGADTQLPKFGDSQLAMSWHNYCLAGDVSGSGGGGAQACGAQELLPFQHAEKRSAATGDPTLLTEFGATDDLETIRRIVTRADQFMIGWQYWHYCPCKDPTTQGPGETQAIVKDPAKPPAGDNLKTAKLDVLVRPYPQLVAGTPRKWSFDEAKGEFVLDYSIQLPVEAQQQADQHGPLLTEVYIPRRRYPSGYAVHAQGAAIASTRGAPTLLLRTCPGAREVKVTVTKSGPSVEDCGTSGVAGAPGGGLRLRLRVTPRKVHAGRPARLRFRVFAGRFAVSGARVRFAGRSVRTDSRGRATMRVRLRRRGTRRAVVTKATFRRGVARVRVVR